jgi:hypothetical protein
VPTGIEELFAAIAGAMTSALEAGAMASPLTGSPPNSAVPAGIAAATADEPFVPPVVLEGDHPAMHAPPSSSRAAGAIGGSATAPLTGDRPPDATHPPPSADPPDPGERRRVWDFDPMHIEAGPDPADQPEAPRPAPRPEPVDSSAAQRAEPPSPNPPASGRPPGTSEQPPTQPTPPMAQAAAAPAVPDASAPAQVPEATPPISAPADVATWWEQHAWMSAPWLLGASGEQVSEGLKAQLSDLLLSETEDSQSDTARAIGAAVAAVDETVADVVIDVVVVPLVDPGSAVRGILRLGSASPYGLRQIESGKTVQGVATITGEVSSAALIVLGGVEGGAVKGPPGEASVTMSLERGMGAERVVGTHNAIEVVSQGRTLATEVTGRLVKGQGVRAFVTEIGQKLQDLGGAVHERAVSAESGKRAQAAQQRSLTERPVEARSGMTTPDTGEFVRTVTKGGDFGPYSKVSAFKESCATYAAYIAREAGILTTGRFGPTVAFLLFQHGPTFSFLGGVGAGAAGGGAAENAVTGVTRSGP